MLNVIIITKSVLLIDTYALYFQDKKIISSSAI